MPLPDASKKSPRIYTLLQNTDLDNVTFDNVQAVGNPIAIEEQNEDEMRRLVLVNLCRLVTSGEWNGLLTAASGGTFNAVLPTSVGTSTRYQIGLATPYSNTGLAGNGTFADFNDPMAYPFIAPESGDVSEIGINCNVATTSADALVGIYTNSGGKPDELLGYADIEMGATGSIYQTSISATITLVAGTQYFYVVGTDATATGGTISVCDGDYITPLGVATTNGAGSYTTCYRHDATVDALPATFAADVTRQTGRVLVSIKM